MMEYNKDMVTVELETSTLAVLIAGLYSTNNNVDVLAIPEIIYLEVAEKLTNLLPYWNYEVISFEEWVRTGLWIYPKLLFDEATLNDVRKNSIYWEKNNGNVVLIISMDLNGILLEQG